MAQQQDEPDPYDLLEIDPELRPPTHYQLLGVDDFETDLDVIAGAAKERGAYLHRIAAGAHRKAVQQLLGEVAIARRTLLNDQSKQAYDRQLLADSQEYEQQHAAGIQISPDADTAPSGKPAGETDRPHARRRRKKSTWDEYKYHLASASVLLLIVGIVWFVNRGGGERRAAKAGVAKSTPATAARVAPARKSSSPAARVASKQPAAPRRQPAGSRRSTPSLAPSFDVQAFLTEDAPSMSKPASAQKAQEAKKDAGTTASAKLSVALNLAANWKPNIEVVDDFAKDLDKRFQFDAKKTPCKIEKGQVVLQPGTAAKYGSIRHKSLKLKAGQAVALEMSLLPALDQTAQIGLAIGPARITLMVTKGQLQVRAKNQSDKKGPSKLLGNLKGTAPPMTLVVMRSKDDPDRLHWLARSADGDLSGQVQLEALPAAALLAIIFTVPEKSTKEPVWFDNLRVGDFSNAPEWKQTDPFKL